MICSDRGQAHKSRRFQLRTFTLVCYDLRETGSYAVASNQPAARLAGRRPAICGAGKSGFGKFAPFGQRTIVWDSSVIGFGARRQAGEAVSYFLKYRTEEGRQRWMTIGRHGSPWTPDMARDRAREILGEVVAGADPGGEKIAKRKALTIAELCDRYFEDALAGRVRTRSKEAKRASTLRIDRGRIDRHIKPLLGAMSVAAVTRHDVEKFLHDVADGRTAGKTKTKARGLARVTGGETAAN